MSAFGSMQVLVACVLVLGVLDTVTTWYGISHGVAKEANGAVDRVLRLVGMSGWGLALVKLPALAQALLAMFPLPLAHVAPNWLLVYAADIPNYAWEIQLGLYTAVVCNNVRVCFTHAIERVEKELKELL